MLFMRTLRHILAAGLLCTAANASTIFSFDNDTLGTTTAFTDVSNGLSATFTSSADAGGFVIYPSIFQTLTGNVLGDPGPAGANDLGLMVTFSQNLSAVTLNFATSDFTTPSPLTLAVYENSNLVGSASATGMFLSNFTFPEGEIAFAGRPFNQLVITSTANDFAIDNLTVLPALAPEPAMAGLLGFGLLILSFTPLRRKFKRPATK